MTWVPCYDSEGVTETLLLLLPDLPLPQTDDSTPTNLAHRPQVGSGTQRSSRDPVERQDIRHSVNPLLHIS